jgi:hypothetical protein
MQLTEEFKQQMRAWLASLFSKRECVICSPLSLGNDLSFDESIWMIHIPIAAGKIMKDFFKEEGLAIVELNEDLYTISCVT